MRESMQGENANKMMRMQSNNELWSCNDNLFMITYLTSLASKDET